MLLRTGGASPYFDELRKRREEERQAGLAELEYQRRREDRATDLQEQRTYDEGQAAASRTQTLGDRAEVERKATEKAATEQQEKDFAAANFDTLSRAAAGQWAEFDPAKLDANIQTALKDENFGTFGVKARYDKAKDIFYIQGTDMNGKDVPGAAQKIPQGHVWLENHKIQHGWEDPEIAAARRGRGTGKEEGTPKLSSTIYVWSDGTSELGDSTRPPTRPGPDGKPETPKAYEVSEASQKRIDNNAQAYGDALFTNLDTRAVASDAWYKSPEGSKKVAALYNDIADNLTTHLSRIGDIRALMNHQVDNDDLLSAALGALKDKARNHKDLLGRKVAKTDSGFPGGTYREFIEWQIGQLYGTPTQ